MRETYSPFQLHLKEPISEPQASLVMDEVAKDSKNNVSYTGVIPRVYVAKTPEHDRGDCDLRTLKTVLKGHYATTNGRREIMCRYAINRIFTVREDSPAQQLGENGMLITEPFGRDRQVRKGFRLNVVALNAYKMNQDSFGT